jgi:hypothetical protein
MGQAPLCTLSLSPVSHISTSAQYSLIYNQGDRKWASKMPSSVQLSPQRRE